MIEVTKEFSDIPGPDPLMEFGQRGRQKWSDVINLIAARVFRKSRVRKERLVRTVKPHLPSVDIRGNSAVELDMFKSDKSLQDPPSDWHE